MESSYKLLGDYIRPVDIRNKDLKISNLLGVSIGKCFIPSIANTVGTDFSNYKIVKQGQFAYGPVTSRNGDKISIALLNGDDCIVSSSYTVFEVTRKDELDPEYLMLWFIRPEFDRYARYRSHGSVREIFDWDEMCAVELPVLNIEKQRKIVKAYKTISDRIALKQRLNDNLTEQMIIMNKTMFPLSSNDNITISDICNKIYSGGTPSTTETSYWNGEYPWFSSGETSNDYVIKTIKAITKAGIKNSSTKLAKQYDTVIASAGVGLTRGQTSLLLIDTYVNQSVIVLEPIDEFAYFLYANLKGRYDEIRNLSDLDSIRGSLTTKTVAQLSIAKVDKDSILNYNRLCSAYVEMIKQNLYEIEKLKELSSNITALISSR